VHIEVVQAKAGAGSATLSMAYGTSGIGWYSHCFPGLLAELTWIAFYLLSLVLLLDLNPCSTSSVPTVAGALFANSVIRGMNGEKGVVTPTFVKSPLYEDQGIEYFSSNVELGVSRGVVVSCLECRHGWLMGSGVELFRAVDVGCGEDSLGGFALCRGGRAPRRLSSRVSAGLPARWGLLPQDLILTSMRVFVCDTS
jgi:hypothetical protein